MRVKKQQLEPHMEQWTVSEVANKYDKAAYCHCVYLIYIQNTSCEMLGWMNHRLESRFWEKYQQPHICRWYHSDGRKWRETKEPLDEGEREKEKDGFKINIIKN